MSQAFRQAFRAASLVAAAIFFVVGGAQAADVYRCTSSSGKVEFSDAPCSNEKASSVVDARPNSLDNSAVREQLLKIENRSLREQLAAQQAAPASVSPGSGDPRRADSSACRSATRDLEVAASSIDGNKALIGARRSAMYAACGLSEPDRQVTNVHVGERADRRPFR